MNPLQSMDRVFVRGPAELSSGGGRSAHAPAARRTSSAGPPPSHATVSTYLSHASDRWLKPLELQSVLVHAKAQGYQWVVPMKDVDQVVELLSTTPPSRPRPGSIYLFSKQQVARWRKDQYQWQGGDRHTNLKLYGVDHLVCYYAKCAEASRGNGGGGGGGSGSGGEEFLGPAGSFQRRGYALIHEPDIVLVHYLDGRIKGTAPIPSTPSHSSVKMEEEEQDARAVNDVGETHQQSGAVDITQFLHHFLPSPHTAGPESHSPAETLRGSMALHLPRSMPSSPVLFPIRGSLQLHPDAHPKEIQYDAATAYMQQHAQSPLTAPAPSHHTTSSPLSPSILSSLLMPTASALAAAATTTMPFHASTHNPFSTSGNRSSSVVGALPMTNAASAAAAAVGAKSNVSTLQQLLGLGPDAGSSFALPPASAFGPPRASLAVVDYSPCSDYIDGASKLLVCVSSSDSSSSPPLAFCHFLHIDAATRLQTRVAVVRLERVACDTYRAMLPVVDVPGDYAFYVSDSEHEPSATTMSTTTPPTRFSQTVPFGFQARDDASGGTLGTATTTAAVVVPNGRHTRARSRPPMIRTRSRDLLLQQSRDANHHHSHHHHRRQVSNSSNSSLSITAAASGAARSISPQWTPTRTANTTSSDAAAGVASHEREFIIALIQRLQHMEHVVMMQHEQQQQQQQHPHPHRHAHARHSFSSPLGALPPSPLLSLLTPDPLSPVRGVALSPRSQPFHLMPPGAQMLPSQTSTTHAHPYPASPVRRRRASASVTTTVASPGRHVTHASVNGSSGGGTSSPAALGLRDLVACILDAPGEDLIESLLLAMLKKILRLDSQYSSHVTNGSVAGGGTAAGSTGLGHANGRSSSSDGAHGGVGSLCSTALVSSAQVRDEHGRQLVHLVSGLAHTHLLALVVSRLAGDVNSRDAQGRTPLHHATMADDEMDDADLGASSPAAMIVSALLSYGADDAVRDAGGLTARALAEASGRAGVVQVFLEVQNAESLLAAQETDAPPTTTTAQTTTTMTDTRANDATAHHHHHHTHHRPTLRARRTSAVSEQEEEEDDDEEDEVAVMADDDDDEAMFANDEVAVVGASGVSSSASAVAAAGAAAAAAAASDAAASGLSLDRSFSSLTLHDMGVNAEDFLLPSVDGDPTGMPVVDDTTGLLVSASALFATPTSHFQRVVSAIQRKIRWWLFRRHMAANKLQSVARGMLARRSLKRMRDASVAIQSRFRQRKVRRDFVRLQQAARLVQEKFRGARGGGGGAAPQGEKVSNHHQGGGGAGGVDGPTGNLLDDAGNESDAMSTRSVGGAVGVDPAFRITPEPASLSFDSLPSPSSRLHPPSLDFDLAPSASASPRAVVSSLLSSSVSVSESVSSSEGVRLSALDPLAELLHETGADIHPTVFEHHHHEHVVAIESLATDDQHATEHALTRGEGTMMT